MVIKKKAKKNAAFNKIKLKVGKKLKKTSTTDTTIKTKKVVLLSQLQEKNGTSEKPLSYRGLSLDELCKQLGHFSKGSDPALSGQLRGLIRVICNASPHSMTAHFTLFVAHLLHALTHNEARVRSFSLSIIALVLCTYPDLCSKNADLFTAFIKFLGGSHKPRWSSPGFLETIVSFIKAYTADRSNRKDVCTEIQLNMDTGEVPVGVNLLKTFSKSNPFDFPVINSSIPTTVSPLEVPESLLSLSEACAPILAMSLSEDRSGSFLGPATSILSLLGNAALNLPNASVVEDFIPRMRKIWTSVKKVATSRKSEKVARATRWLNDF
uniref:Ipi1_N domain-containing protein n=1 Tax=Angiostrongylus cantonensis TaxID=6313 RepID=A0A0K0DMI9_ANGCA